MKKIKKNISGYTLEDFDDQGFLKVGFLGWVIILAMTHEYWVLVGTIFSRSSGMIGLMWGDSLFKRNLLTQLPSLLILFVAINRKAGLGKIQSFLWKSGRVLLSISAIASILSLIPIISGVNIGTDEGELLVSFLKFLLFGFCFCWIVLSKRSKDLFK